MNILVLNYEFPPLGGGGGIAAYKLAKGWVDLGHSVDYITTWYQGLPHYENVDGIHIHRVKVVGRKELSTATMLSMVTYPLPAYRKALQLAKQKKYAWINTHFAVPTGPAGLWVANKLKIPNVLSLHGGDIFDPSKKNSPHTKVHYRSVVKWVLKKADMVVAQSRNTQDNTRRYYVCQSPIKIIPLPYTPAKFSEKNRVQLQLDDNKKYLISVGRLVKRKDYQTLVKALSMSEDANVELLLLGEGPERKTLVALAASLQISDRVHFLGFVSEEKKFQYLQNSDLYVLSSLHEGFGIVLQEAMQVGLPIVATNQGGQTDFVKDGLNGFLVNVGDVKQMTEKIATILNSTVIRKKMAEENLAKIKEFSTEKICKEYLSLLP